MFICRWYQCAHETQVYTDYTGTITATNCPDKAVGDITVLHTVDTGVVIDLETAERATGEDDIDRECVICQYTLGKDEPLTLHATCCHELAATDTADSDSV